MRSHWRILGVLAAANVAAYAARNSLFAIYDKLRDEFPGIGDANVGLLTTAFLVPHALATLVFGWAGDRYDRRRVIATGLAIASVAGACGVLARSTESVAVLAASRALVGVGTAALVPVANSIFGQLFAADVRASRVAIFNLGLLAGGIVGFGSGMAFGFPWVTVVLAAPTALLALAILRLPVPEHPASDAARSMRLSRYVGAFFGDARALLASRTLRWVIVSATAMAFAAGGYNAWLLDLLVTDKGMSRGAATTLMSIAMVGAVAGIVTGGRVADRLRARSAAGRLWTIVIGMAASVPFSYAFIEMPAGPALYACGVAALFFMFWYHAPMAVTVDDLAPAERVVAAQGLVIFVMHMFGTAPSSFVVGVISEHASLRAAMWAPTVALAVAAVAMALATPGFQRDAITKS